MNHYKYIAVLVTVLAVFSSKVTATFPNEEVVAAPIAAPPAYVPEAAPLAPVPVAEYPAPAPVAALPAAGTKEKGDVNIKIDMRGE